MSLLEAEATRLGYHYLYLWTKDAAPFYQRCGFMVCEKVSLHKPCLNALEEHQLSSLEKMLAAQLLRAQGNVAAAAAAAADADATPAGSKDPNGGEAAASNGDIDGGGDVAPAGAFAENVAGAADVWLRKRLVESVGSVMPSKEEQEAQLQDALTGIGVSTSDQQQWRWVVQPVPWQRQIGPSCGLAALRMVRDHYMLRAAAAQNEQEKARESVVRAAGAGAGGAGIDVGAGGSGNSGSAPVPTAQKRSLFTGAKWGMSARLVGGPIVVTRVTPNGEAARLGVKMGDIILGADDISVDDDRAAVVARVRKGGRASILLTSPAPLFGGVTPAAGSSSDHSPPPSTASGAPSCPSLLAAAQERGFSADGEIFDAEHLTVIAREVCGVNATCESFEQLTPASAAEYVRGGRLLIVPYDSHPGSKLPAALNGNSAHYGVVIGVCYCAAITGGSSVKPSTCDGNSDQTTPPASQSRLLPPPPPPLPVADGPKPWLQGETAPANLSGEHLLLLVQHSNSARLAIATYTDFLRSNLQMTSFDASRFAVCSLNLSNQVVVAKGLLE